MQQRNQPVNVTVKLIRELHMRDPGTLHFLNVRLRADLQRLQLVQLGRYARAPTYLSAALSNLLTPQLESFACATCSKCTLRMTRTRPLREIAALGFFSS